MGRHENEVIKVKVIDSFNGITVYQALNHEIYYMMAKKIYSKIPTMVEDQMPLHVTLKEITLKEFDELYKTQGLLR